ncbi:hypothetical protein MP228_012290 [Amoeboaphelidium protococcarum]|nr:hypothetical protein MP228_012290 [Amoeboaphelidium protococcarum]
MSVIQKSVKDYASLQNEFNKLVVLFSKKEDETTWKQFDEAITVLNVWCGDENVCRLSGFRDGMKTIGSGLKQCLLSDRSKLSGNACNLIMKLSHIWRSDGNTGGGDNDDSESFQILNDISFDALLKLCARANKINVVRGQSTLQELAKCFSASIGWLIRFNDSALCKHPNKNVRNAVALCILVIISHHGKLLSVKFEGVMSTLISGLITDADGGVRDTAKKCLQEYCSYDLSSCQTIVANLPPQYAKSCQQILHSYSGAGSTAPARKANAQSSQKQKVQPQTRVVNEALKVQVDAVTIIPQQEEICVNAPSNSVIGKNEIRMRSRKQRMTCAVLMPLNEFQVAQSITDAPSVVSRSEVQSLAPRDDSEIGRKRNITEDFRDFLEFKNRKIKSAHASDEEKLKAGDDSNAASASAAPKPILRKFKSMKQQAAKDVVFAPEIASVISINQMNAGELQQVTAVLKDDSIQTFDEKIKVQCELAQSNESDVQAQRNALNKLMEYVTDYRSISDESKQLITQSVLHCLNSGHSKVLHSTLDLLLMILRNLPAILTQSYSEIYVSLLKVRVKSSHMHSLIDEILKDVQENHLKPNVVVTLLIEFCERAQVIADSDSLLLYGCSKLIKHGVHYDSASLYKRVVLLCVELIQKVQDDQMLKNLADHLNNLQKEHQKTFKALFLQLPTNVQNFLQQYGVQCQLSSSTATISEDSKSTHTPRNQNLQVSSQSKVVLSSKVEYRRKEYEVDVASPVQNDEDVNNDMIDVTPIPSSSIMVDVESIVDSTPTQASVLKGHDSTQLFQFWDILDNCICDAVQQSQIRQQKQFTADDTLQRLVECKINAEQARDLIPQLLLKDSTTDMKKDLVEALICFGGRCNNNLLISKQYILHLLSDLTLQDIFSIVHKLSADSQCHQLSIFALHEKLPNCNQMNLTSEDLRSLMRLLFRQIKSEDSITAVKSRDCLQMLRKLSISDAELWQMFNQESQSFLQKDDGQQKDVEKMILEQKFREMELHQSGDEM